MNESNDNANNPALREYVTGHAFAMTLSRSMISMLDALAHGARPPHGVIRQWISTGHSLQERGLMEWRGVPKPPFAKDPKGKDNLDPIANRMRLTRAGWIMHDLLGEAGLVKPIAKQSPLRRKVA